MNTGKPVNSEDARRESFDLLTKILAAKPDFITASIDPEETAERFLKAARKLGAYIWPDFFKA
ncbi:MAG: hypothetical protein WC683_07815 [bacterium]